MKRWLLVSTALTLSGCATAPTAPSLPTVDTTSSPIVVSVDKELRQNCEPIPKLLSGDEAAIVAYTRSVFALYQQCAAKTTGWNNSVCGIAFQCSDK